MLGNDVVDLQLARHQTRWKTKRFQQKVLHPNEIENFKNNKLNFIEFWKIWSVKETVYKAHQRKVNHLPKFNPFHFEVKFISKNRSKVTLNHQEYSVNTIVNKDFIYSYIEANETYSVQNFHIEAKNASFEKDLVRSDLNSNLIKNRNRVPFLVKENKLTPISITHHGSFFAYVYKAV